MNYWAIIMLSLPVYFFVSMILISEFRSRSR